MLKIDIWDNVTYYVNKEVWYKQTFIEDELISYEDYLGNYWVKDFGEFKLSIVEYSSLITGINADLSISLNVSPGSTFITVMVNYLCAIKGTTFLDAGVVYAPYIPVNMPINNLDEATKLALERDITSTMSTRYAKKVVNTSFYGTISVTNPDLILSLYESTA